MAASKRSRRMKVPIEILFCAALFVASFVVYWAAITLHARMLGHSSARPSSYIEHPVDQGRGSPPLSTPDSSTSPESADQGQQMYQVGEYVRLYGERQRSLLANGATNLNPEAVERAGDWKRAGDWDEGFLRMNETFKASVDPALAPAVPAFQVPAFQVPPFQVPAVQLPTVPACCVTP